MSQKNKNEKHSKFFKTRNVSNENGDAPDAPAAIVLEDEIDPCAPKEKVDDSPIIVRSPGNDPRFQQQNQTHRCYVMYTDFYQCEYLLGEGHEACTWFKDVFTRICPNAWIERWDGYRAENRMPWFKRCDEFPKAPYGKLS